MTTRTPGSGTRIAEHARSGSGFRRSRGPSPSVSWVALELFSSLWLAIALVSPSPAWAADAAVRPNIVFVLADDLGWSDLACYGSQLHETPRLDQFAQQALRFTDAYAAPVCSPTRASLMTGKAPARLHITIWREGSANPPRNRRLLPPVAVSDLPHSEITVAERLQAAGYLTALVGKWHLGDATHYPETQGFDVNIGGTLWARPTASFTRTPEEIASRNFATCPTWNSARRENT